MALAVPVPLAAAAAPKPAAAKKQPAATQPAPPPVTEEALLGLARDDAVRLLGKPQSTVRRGEREILIYANGARVELVDNEVVAFQGRPEAVIIASDGTRYTPQDNGNLAVKAPGRAAPTREPADEAAPPAPAPAPEPQTKPEPPAPVKQAPPPPESAAAPDKAAPAPAAAAAPEPVPQPSGEPPAAVAAPAVAQPVPADGAGALPASIPEPPTPGSVQQLMEDSGLDFESPPPPRWFSVVSEIVGMIVRFGLVVLILSLAMKWMELPFYWPDLMKVSVLYVAVRGAVHGIGGFDGAWELLLLFRIDEAVSFVAMAILLYRFEVTRNGLTALKIAAATMLVTYFLMMAFMIVLTFALLAFA